MLCLLLDIDECTEGVSGCNDYADCINLPGSYKCTCKEGFSGDGKKSCIGTKKFVIIAKCRKQVCD